MNGADSEPRRQLPTTAAREMTASRVNRPTMYVNRNKLLAEQVFKIIHDLSPPILPD